MGTLLEAIFCIPLILILPSYFDGVSYSLFLINICNNSLRMNYSNQIMILVYFCSNTCLLFSDIASDMLLFVFIMRFT